jgi:uncharacterized protein YcnI
VSPRRLLAAVALVGALPVGTALAHTETDVVAVPAGETAEVTLRPTHGCGDSPTVEVAARAPVAGAQAGGVEGWSVTVEDEGEGDATVLEWTGGILPADQAGAFPIRFTAPDAEGELLTFPFVQVCQDGTELAWIDGDPSAAYPAPRLLVLAPGSTPAATIDDVPPDAPGRGQLAQIVDVDNPAEPATTSTSPTSEPDTEVTTSTTSTTTSEPAPVEDVTAEEDDDDGSSALPIVVAAVVVLAFAVGAWWALRRRDRGATD